MKILYLHIIDYRDFLHSFYPSLISVYSTSTSITTNPLHPHVPLPAMYSLKCVPRRNRLINITLVQGLGRVERIILPCLEAQRLVELELQHSRHVVPANT